MRWHLRGEDVWNGYDRVAFHKYNLGFSYDDPKVDVGLARDQRNLFTRFADVVHGAYRHYDWTDLLPNAVSSGAETVSDG